MGYKLTKLARRFIDPVRETDVCPFPVKKFTISEYQKLLEVGIFISRDPYELLEGWIVTKPKRGPRNCFVTGRLERQLSTLDLDGYCFSTCIFPITCPNSELEPSCSIFFGDSEDYDQRHPGPKETAIVFEVSDQTLIKDQGIKQEIYAKYKIPVYWIINLIHSQIEVYTKPKAGKKPGYGKVVKYKPGDDVPVTIAGKKRGTIAVSAILP